MTGERFEGKNLEEALEAAARGLGVERHRVGYSVVVERRGFLGGIKRLVIEARILPEGEAPSTPPEELPAAFSSDAPDVSEASRTPRPDVEEPRERSGSRGRGPRREKGRGRQAADRDQGRAVSSPRDEGGAIEILPTPDQGEQSPDAGKVAAWFRELLRLSGLELDVRTEESGDQLKVHLFGRDGVRLLARDGELLDSIQVIANKAFNEHGPGRKIEVDYQSFKERRAGELSEKALVLAERVRQDGGEQMLPAMTPAERRIVHLALQDDADITTESRGEGIYKRVAIVRRGASAPGGK